MGRIITSSRLALGLSGVALLAAASGGTYALAAGRTSTITVCVKKRGGALYKAARCARGDHRLSWSTLGPQGPAGEPGTTGSTGATGPAGATGLTGPAGPAGKDGTNGTNGTDGTNGTNGIGATTGTFTESFSNTQFPARMGNLSAYVYCGGSSLDPQVVFGISDPDTEGWTALGQYASSQWPVGSPQAEAATTETVADNASGSSLNLFTAPAASAGDAAQVSGTIQVMDHATKTTYVLDLSLLAGSGACEGFVTTVPSTSS